MEGVPSPPDRTLLMRKQRLRALKAAFQRVHGRQPNGIELQKPLDNGAVPYIPSEVRKIKKGFLEVRRSNGQ